MPIQYTPTKHAYHTVGDSLTEPEHQKSCDINHMISDVKRGLQVRGAKSQSIYGVDDTTLDGVQLRIKKEQLETELSKTAQANEFSPEELKHIPNDVQKKFGFKTKKESKVPKTNDDPNDDKKLDQDSNSKKPAELPTEGKSIPSSKS